MAFFISGKIFHGPAGCYGFQYARLFSLVGGRFPLFELACFCIDWEWKREGLSLSTKSKKSCCLFPESVLNYIFAGSGAERECRSPAGTGCGFYHRREIAV